MSAMIQIRNVPDEVHRELKVRAAREGRSLSDYLLRELERLAARPPVDDVLARIRRRGRLDVAEPPAEAVRAERDARG
ncbi:MAG TPA: hypothetical protein VM324_01950 [Egibacteraceae bacterium]|nr:hypothetical protein [Egibacteraceae bacterium]